MKNDRTENMTRVWASHGLVEQLSDLWTASPGLFFVWNRQIPLSFKPLLRFSVKCKPYETVLKML